MDALSDSQKLFPKKAVMDAGISNHMSRAHGRRAVFAVVTVAESNVWRNEITASLRLLPPEERWWKGLDVGVSSAAIFGVLAENKIFGGEALRMSDGATPLDADDFGRCARLVADFMWKGRLAEVAEAYPLGKWPAIVARWDEIANAPDILRSL